MKDIRISICFWDHWKTVTLKADLGVEAVESLQRLWCFAAINKPSGVLDGMSQRAIEMASRWSGSSGALLAKLEELCFLEKRGDWYAIHDWADHNSFAATADARSAQAKAAVNRRWEKRRGGGSDTGSNTERITERSTECNTPYPSPSPYPSPLPKQQHSPASAEAQVAPENPAAVAADRFDATGFLVEHGADQQTAADYLELRKAKKAASTRTALRSVVEEARKAGIPVGVALTTCCARGWAGFKADWVEPKPRDGPAKAAKFDPVAHVNRNRIRQSETANIIDITAERLA